MSKNIQSYIIASNHGINYYVIQSENGEGPRTYGIFAEMSEDKTDCESAKNLFFTQNEAEEYCKWLAENEVYPISLCEVLGNIYHLQI